MKSTDPIRRQRGTQLIEVAILMPLMLLLTFIVIEGADVVRTHILLNNAAREAARLSAQPENRGAPGQVALAITGTPGGILERSGFPLAQIPSVTVTVNQNGKTQADYGAGALVTITTSVVILTYPYPLQYMPNLQAWGFSDGSTVVNLTASAEFRNLY
jgi:TadE-like protein